MRFLLKVKFPVEATNRTLRDPEFGPRMRELLAEIKAEAAYFSLVDGQRGAYILVDMEDASQMPAIGEPFFYWFNADIELLPVMRPEDLGKAGPAIEAAAKRYGNA